MPDPLAALPIIVYDDREKVNDHIAGFVGHREFGSIRVRNSTLYEQIREVLPSWARDRLYRVSPGQQLDDAYRVFPKLATSKGVIVLAARGAVADAEDFANIIERLILAGKHVADRFRSPLLRFFYTVDAFLDTWEDFSRAPLHMSSAEVSHISVFEAPFPLTDISSSERFLDFVAGATAPRAFNSVEIGKLVYVKRSTDKAKIKAEHDFYDFVPASMKHWLVGAYNYREDSATAQYEMPRRYIADAATQWIHDAWSESNYLSFIERILFFLQQRPTKPASAEEVERIAHECYIAKVERRRAQLQNSVEGRHVIALLENSKEGSSLMATYDDYFDLVNRNWSALRGDNELVIGHGDPCLSNILYDSSTLTLQLIDPRGASTELELWTHKAYDYAKLSHSILGDYDFINNRMFNVSLARDASLKLHIDAEPSETYKAIFKDRTAAVLDYSIMRLAEASLFLSMPPLHLDHPDKIAAFILRARSIVDEISEDLR